jgi:hypothetical protein
VSFRHARRHMEESARKHVADYLTTLGWLDSVQANRPFKAPGAATVIAEFTGLDGSRQVAAGTGAPLVSVAIPAEGVDQDQEIGGPLVQTNYDLFVSVLAVPALVGVLTEDVVDLLAGRSARPVIPFVDQASAILVPGETLELQDVSADRARADRDDWMLVTATIVRTFSRTWS